MMGIKMVTLQLFAVWLTVNSCLAAVILTAGPEPAGKSEVQQMIQNSRHSSWCNIGHIRQIITHAYCESQEVENRVCAGSCYSYSLPKTIPQTAGDGILGFCESCQPSNSYWVNITLTCKKDEKTFEITKSVQQISNCTCASCPGIQSEESNSEDERISGLLSSALPDSATDSEDVDMENRNPLDILTSPSFGPSSTSDGEVNQSSPNNENESSNPISSDSSAGKDLRGPPYQDFPGPNLLEEEEVIFNPEGEKDPNLLNSNMADENSHSELTNLMESLNLILDGNGPVNYQKLSISELKDVIHDLNKNKKREAALEKAPVEDENAEVDVEEVE